MKTYIILQDKTVTSPEGQPLTIVWGTNPPAPADVKSPAAWFDPSNKVIKYKVEGEDDWQ